jgi:hypothetical protein
VHRLISTHLSALEYPLYDVLSPFHLVPIIDGWPEAVLDEKHAQCFTHDQLGNRTPDLSLSGPTPLPLGHELQLS